MRTVLRDQSLRNPPKTYYTIFSLFMRTVLRDYIFPLYEDSPPRIDFYGFVLFYLNPVLGLPTASVARPTGSTMVPLVVLSMSSCCPSVTW